MPVPVAQFADLEDAAVLVTGGSSGIGAALAEGFAAQGACVAILDIDAIRGEALAGRMSQTYGKQHLFFETDLRNVEATKAAVQAAASALGGIRVVVNNAGWDDRHDVAAVSEAYWDQNLAVNLKPMFFVTQAALPYLSRAGGSVINFSSIAYLLNLPDFPAYATAKAGIIGLTKALAGKLGPDNIRVNAILPGMILTERQKQLWITQSDADAMVARQCLKFSLSPEDLVGPCLFLASDCSRAITAQSLIVDGGCL